MVERWVQALVLALLAVIVVAAAWTDIAGGDQLYRAAQPPAELPGTALVLGSKVSDGVPGEYVRGRLDTAVELYQAGQISRIVTSGNGSDEAGNETAVMADYLVAHGVPREAIEQDPEGFDTDASCRRLPDEFGTDQVVVITQDFHLARAVALCRRHGVDAVGVVAGCDYCSVAGISRNHLRETVLARPRAFVGVFGWA